MSRISPEQFEKEEAELQFPVFSRADALELGLLIEKKSHDYPDPVAIEIVMNGISVFRYFPDGAMPDCSNWLQKKRRSVELMAFSSLHFWNWLEQTGQTLKDRKVDPDLYAACGGGFPVILKGTGMVGSICVSGLPDHLDDHQLIIDSLTEFLGSRES